MWTIARAFAPGKLTIEADDISRVDANRAAIASVSTAAFQAIDPAATRAAVDRAMAAWANDPVAAAAAEVRARGEDAFGSLLLARLAGTVEITWLGLAGAWMLVAGEPVAVARRHSLREQGGPDAPDVPVRGLGGANESPESASWTPLHRARVVCASWTIARFPTDLVARLATGETPDRGAQRLVDTAIRREPQWPAVAIVADWTG